MSESCEPLKWLEHSIADRREGIYGFEMRTSLVRREDPPKIGPDDDNLQWYEVKVQLLMGGAEVGPSVRFPAHEPLAADVAFRAVMKAALNPSA